MAAGYATWLTGLVDLPAEIVRTLNLLPVTPASASAAPARVTRRAAIPVDSGEGQVFSSWVWRLVGEGGIALITIASGALFGGLALFGAWFGLQTGYSTGLFWYFWSLIAAGLPYGTYAISLGARDVLRLAWRWNAPLRSIKRP